MSRSNNTEIVNPASRFYQWDGAVGGFRYWDKNRGEHGEKVHVDLPFRFVVLDCLSTIRGYSDANTSGFWSNEVRDIKRDILTVKTKKGIAAKGVYSEIITNRACTGAKYCQSVYIAFREPGATLEICNLQLTGAALSSWIEFRKKERKIYDGAIDVATMVEGKKGATTYQIPVFKKLATSPETEATAVLLDKELQEYLGAYFKRTQDDVAQVHAEEISSADDMSDVPPPDDDYAPVATGEKYDPSEPLF